MWSNPGFLCFYSFYVRPGVEDVIIHSILFISWYYDTLFMIFITPYFYDTFISIPLVRTTSRQSYYCLIFSKYSIRNNLFFMKVFVYMSLFYCTSVYLIVLLSFRIFLYTLYKFLQLISISYPMWPVSPSPPWSSLKILYLIFTNPKKIIFFWGKVYLHSQLFVF